MFSQPWVIPSVHGGRGSASGEGLRNGASACWDLLGGVSLVVVCLWGGRLGRPETWGTTGCGQQAGSTHPTRMNSGLLLFFCNVRFPLDLKLESQAISFGRGIETLLFISEGWCSILTDLTIQLWIWLNYLSLILELDGIHGGNRN